METDMRSIGVRELKERTSQVLRTVREQGEEIEVTHHGRVVARLVPVARERRGRRTSAATWSTIDRVAREIGARWPKGKSAVDAVRDARRDL
jgi:prevent-host-death family protein